MSQNMVRAIVQELVTHETIGALQASASHRAHFLATCQRKRDESPRSLLQWGCKDHEELNAVYVPRTNLG